MYRHYITIALRNVMKKRLFAAINIFGLAVGMACFILIFLWIQDELSYDKFHVNKNELYLINIKHPEDLKGYGDANAPYALAPVLANNYPEIVDYTRIINLSSKMTCSFSYWGNDETSREKMLYEDKVYLVDTSFFSMFTFHFVYGNSQTAFLNQNSLVITDEIARKYFGNENPLDKVLKFNNRQNYVVTGVVKVPSNSHIKFDFVVPLIDKRLKDWNWADPSYIQVKKNISIQGLKNKIADSLNRYNPSPLAGTFKVDILPITQNHLYFGRKVYVYIFSIIACFILLIASINYMNLTTASSVNRSKEIGVRKVLGVERSQLIKQFFGESILFAVLALIPATILANIFLPFLNRLAAKDLTMFHSDNPFIFLILFGLAIVVGIVSGSYPAIFLASFKPIKTLGVSKSFKTSRSLFRVISVVGQFVISILLIICTIAILRQLNYIRNRPLGFKLDYVVSIPINGQMIWGFNSFKNELLSNPNVLNVTAGQSVPFNEDYKTNGIEWDNKSPDLSPLFRYSIIQYNFIETFSMKIAAGRSFSEKYPSDRDNYMINEEAARYMNMKEPVGQRLSLWNREGIIIGVIKNYHHVPLHREILPQIFTIQPMLYSNLKFIFIKIRSVNIPETINHISTVTRKFSPDYPFKYSFLDEEIGNLYQTEQRLGEIFSFASLIAIFISCLGIFGLATFTAERCTKEIGIRKAFGASVFDIVVMLTKEFVRWVLLASIVAFPIAWYLMKEWLHNFAYRTTMSAWIFILSGGLALIIALAAVSYQSIKTALTNPAEVLHYE